MKVLYRDNFYGLKIKEVNKCFGLELTYRDAIHDFKNFVESEVQKILIDSLNDYSILETYLVQKNISSEYKKGFFKKGILKYLYYEIIQDSISTENIKIGTELLSFFELLMDYLVFAFVYHSTNEED